MRPLDYPGLPADVAGVLDVDGGWTPLGDAELPAHLLTGRTCVVAVGSNAAPEVLHAKLVRAGAATAVPMAPYDLTGLGIAHSAHVSPGGYVPVAPYAAPGARTRVVAAWLDGEALAAVDATEPNYVRRPLPDAVTGAPPDAEVYVSRRGVLAPGGAPLAPTTQAGVHAVLATDPVLAALLPLADPVATVCMLAGGAAVRRQVRGRLETLGWVLDRC